MNLLHLFGFVFFQVILETTCTDPYAAIPSHLKKGISRTSNTYAYPYSNNGYYPSQQNSYSQPGYSNYPYINSQSSYSTQQMYSPPQIAMPYNYAPTQPYYYPNINYLNSPHLQGNAIASSYAGIPNQQIPYPWRMTFPTTYPATFLNRNATSYAGIPNIPISFPWGNSFPTPYPSALLNRNYTPMLGNNSTLQQQSNSTENGTNINSVQPLQSSYYPNEVTSPSEGDQSLTSPVITTNGETGTDMNSLPPQVKEFIDMIPEILSMPENSPPAESPQPSFPTRPRPMPQPLRKHHKTLPSYKKKAYDPQGYYE